MMNEKVETKDTLVAKLLRLHDESKDVKKMSKAAAKDYKDQLKEIDKEIDDTVASLNNVVGGVVVTE